MVQFALPFLKKEILENKIEAPYFLAFERAYKEGGLGKLIEIVGFQLREQWMSI